MAGPSWFLDICPCPGTQPWGQSVDGGFNYFVYAGLSTPEPINGAYGLQRYKRTFTVPPGVVQTSWLMRPTGDIWDADNGIGPDLYVDGILVAHFDGNGSPTPQVIAVPPAGIHTIELVLAATGSQGGLTNMQFTTQLFDRLPCDCCPQESCGKTASGERLFACKAPNGSIVWYDQFGQAVASANVLGCNG